MAVLAEPELLQTVTAAAMVLTFLNNSVRSIEFSLSTIQLATCVLSLPMGQKLGQSA